MRIIDAINVNDAFHQGVVMLLDNDDVEVLPSRAGDVIELGPVTTVYRQPCQRVLWDAARDCNPFFHLFESIWMLAGMNDVASLTDYNKRMATFSDDGVTFHGAYGFRWRHFFGFDQLNEAVRQLREDPWSRRVVVTMWSPLGDMVCTDGGAGGGSSKDLPCNLMIKFEVRKGALNMIVFNRSNDMIWGTFGANAVHFSVLQEYMAARVGVKVGTYWQVSGNLHTYVKTWEEVRMRAEDPWDLGMLDSYDGRKCSPMPLVADPAYIDNDILAFMGSTSTGDTGAMDSGRNPFFDTVAYPLDDIWTLWKSKERARALLEILKLDQSIDWVLACRLWMERRITK